MRLPVAFGFPLSGIVRRIAVGIALLIAAAIVLSFSGYGSTAIGIGLAILGCVAAGSNLWALTDPSRRTIALSDAGVEVRYGFSRRYYRFADYSAFRIAPVGFRRFLTAIPLEVERALGERASRTRVSLFHHPAIISPMPLFGDGAPNSLIEWQLLLNDLRDAALAAAQGEGAAHLTREAAVDRRRASDWAAARQAGAQPSRLSRRGYARWQFLIIGVFLAILLLPTAFGLIAGAGAFGAAVSPLAAQGLLIGGPVLALLVFFLGNARLVTLRAHDLDEDMPFHQALFGSVARSGVLRSRLTMEEGTPGPNRFGPPPLS